MVALMLEEGVRGCWFDDCGDARTSLKNEGHVNPVMSKSRGLTITKAPISDICLAVQVRATVKSQ